MYLCTCVRGINFAYISTIVLLDFGTVLTLWYFFFFILSIPNLFVFKMIFFMFLFVLYFILKSTMDTFIV